LVGSLVALVVVVGAAAACGPECALSEADLHLLRTAGSFRIQVDAAPRSGESASEALPFADGELQTELAAVLKGEGVPVHDGTAPETASRLLILKARVWREGDGSSYSLLLSPAESPAGPKAATAEPAWPHRSHGPVAADALRATVLRHVRAMGRQLGRLYREARNSP
jgi:hypothetical protein